MDWLLVLNSTEQTSVRVDVTVVIPGYTGLGVEQKSSIVRNAVINMKLNVTVLRQLLKASWTK